jgi:hypothetical protein
VIESRICYYGHFVISPFIYFFRLNDLVHQDMRHESTCTTSYTLMSSKLWKKNKIHTAAISSVFSDLSRIHGQILVI